AGLQQRPQRLRDGVPGREYTQAVRMVEFEVGISLLDLVPESPDAEALAIPGLDVVEQDDPPIGHLRQPRIEIVTDGVIGVKTIDVKDVDATVPESRQGLVEGGSDEFRE